MQLTTLCLALGAFLCERPVLFDSGGDQGMTPAAAEVVLLESEPDCP